MRVVCSGTSGKVVPWLDEMNILDGRVMLLPGMRMGVLGSTVLESLYLLDIVVLASMFD